MQSPYHLENMHARDRISTFFQEAETGRLQAEARRGMPKSEPWLASLASQVKAAARRATDAIGSPAARPSDPAEQCC